MALDLIANNATNYQDITRTAQNIPVSSNTIHGTGDVQSAAKILLEQKKSSDSNQQKEEAEANSQRIKNAINQANDKMKHVRTGCEFSYNDEINRVSIKIYDKDTKEVIREIPPEESLKMLEKVWEIAGLLVDEKR